MAERTIKSEGEKQGWQRQVIPHSTSRTRSRREKLQRLSLATVVINTGARRYGLPANAKERRM